MKLNKKWYGKEYFKGYTKQAETYNKNQYRKLLKKLEKYRKNNILLEVGSAYGWLLEVAREKKWGTCGIEISKHACDVAEERGKGVYWGTVEENIDNIEEDFDVIIMINVIEHMENPIGTLKLLYGKLREGGIIYITCPNSDYIYGETENERHEHLWQFTIDNMKETLKKAGITNFNITLRNPIRITIGRIKHEIIQKIRSND